jgi:GWxTD domain-containing protein
MKIKSNFIPVFIVSLVIIMTGCGTTSKVSLQNLVFLFQPEKQFADLKSCVYHNSDSTSTLFVKVLFNDLLYVKDPYTGLYACSYRLSYSLNEGYEGKVILQTASVISGDSINYGKSAATVHSFEIKVSYPNKYLLEIVLFDLNRHSGTTVYLEVDKRSAQGRQNFLVVNRDRELVYDDFLPAEEPFQIISNRTALAALFVNKYVRDFPVARPPYTDDREPAFDYKPDSIYMIPLYNGESDLITLGGPGFYHFRQDTVSREGLTLFCFPDGFPEITEAEQLRSPLRYITTKKEYDTLMESSNIKAAVDEFWLKMTRTPERASLLFQKYYSNVEDANTFFTSYHEGWKTDRGLIYIIFGMPDYAYRGEGYEEWVYGEPQNRSSLQFTFVQVNNPFTCNDYMLLRSPTLKEPWFVTVQSWRR